MENMFCFCTNLKELNLPPCFNTQNVTNMMAMFGFCENLEELNLPPSFNTQNVTNMKNMFYDCKNLKELNLTSKNSIEEEKNKTQKFKQQQAASAQLHLIFDYNVNRIKRMNNKEQERLHSVFQQICDRLNDPKRLARLNQVKQFLLEEYTRKYGNFNIDKGNNIFGNFNINEDSNDKNNTGNNVDEDFDFENFDILRGTSYANMSLNNIQENQIEDEGTDEVSNDNYDPTSTVPFNKLLITNINNVSKEFLNQK